MVVDGRANTEGRGTIDGHVTRHLSSHSIRLVIHSCLAEDDSKGCPPRQCIHAQMGDVVTTSPMPPNQATSLADIGHMFYYLNVGSITGPSSPKFCEARVATWQTYS